VKETAFGLFIPEDTDSPNGPAQIGGNAEKLDPLLYRAGAQAKKSIIATEQARTNAAYGTLTTPDQVTGLVVSTGDLLYVAFTALVKALVGGRVAIFLTKEGGSAIQLKMASGNDSGVQTQEAAQGDGGGAGVKFGYCSTFTGGLQLGASLEGPEDAAEVTTGMILGQIRGYQAFNGGEAKIAGRGSLPDSDSGGACGPVCIHNLAEGKYTVSIQYKASGGSTITAKNRRLYAWTEGFA
jgi:hypothetical protein